MSDRLPQPASAQTIAVTERASATPVVTLRSAEPRVVKARPTPGPAPNSLADVERWMLTAITDEDADTSLAEVLLTGGPRLSAAERLEIYRGGYHARLVDCLLDDYPALAALLGGDRFHALCHGYIAAHPSTSPNLNGFGRHMASFCRDERGLERLSAFASELAALEWAIVEVLHAASAGRLDLSSLASLPPEAWAPLRLVASEAVRVLRFSHPVNAFYQAWRDDLSPGAPEPEASTTVIYRSELSVWRMDLTPAMTRVLDALLAGETLETSLAEIAVDERDAEALAEAERSVMIWFREWVSGGLFARIE